MDPVRTLPTNIAVHAVNQGDLVRHAIVVLSLKFWISAHMHVQHNCCLTGDITSSQSSSKQFGVPWHNVINSDCCPIDS